MSRRKFSAVLFSLLLVGASAFARQVAADTPKPSKVFQEARAVNADATPDPEAFEFELNGFAYHVNANGNGRRTKGTKTRGFNLYSEFEGDLLLLLHTNVEGVGLGFVTLLGQPSMRGLWRQRIPAGDVGAPLRDGHDLYVTGLGLVGKLDLRTGEYDWQLDDLEVERGDDRKPLHTFDPPELDGDAVLFRERPVYNPRRTLVLDRKSGKVIRVE
jgi:hypothetical protein